MLEVLIDTGSDYSLMKWSTMRQLQLTIRSGNGLPHLTGIPGRELRVLGKIKTTLTISTAQNVEVDMVVVPDRYLSTPVL